MHNLSTSFVLRYHGCDVETGDRLLLSEPFRPSENTYDWLGSGVYFWESNPDRALEWARDRADRILKNEGREVEPFVVGAVIDPGFCLDLISSNGIHAVEEAYASFQSVVAASGAQLPENVGGDDLRLRKLDCAVINFLHLAREKAGDEPFDTVRGVFTDDIDLPAPCRFQQLLPQLALGRTGSYFLDLQSDRPATPDGILAHGAILHGKRLLIHRGDSGLQAGADYFGGLLPLAKNPPGFLDARPLFYGHFMMLPAHGRRVSFPAMSDSS